MNGPATKEEDSNSNQESVRLLVQDAQDLSVMFKKNAIMNVFLQRQFSIFRV